jgi:hypothetical protein
MNRCAYPGCPTQLVTTETGTIIGEVCHIRAQNVGGPRYLESQDDEERHGFDNLILMCRNHHKEIDAPANRHLYTVEWLLETKRAHEAQARVYGEIDAPETVIVALSWSASIYEAGATHMDFRGAVFDLGGKGGGLSGGGGSGGVLTIVGLASVPSEMKVELDGEAGQFFGGGGGGAGAVNYQGRPATEEDVANGLKVPLFFPVNSCHVADGLFFILGAGWESMPVDAFPYQSRIALALMVECGDLDPNVLIGFELIVKDPAGTEHTLGVVDVEVPEPRGSINRRNQVTTLPIELETAGIYTLSVQSGGAPFARYMFEARFSR